MKIANISTIENTMVAMSGALLDWVTLDRIGIIIGIFMGVSALFFKWKGWRTAEDANIIAREALIVPIQRDFASKDFYNAKKSLWDFYRQYGDKIGEEYSKMLDIIDRNENSEELKKAVKIDKARWVYVHLFYRYKKTLKIGHDYSIKDIIYPDEIKLLLIIKPMEEVKAQHCGEDFVGDMFDDLREMYKDELKEKGLEERRE